ncbi:MAG: hypothetical protein A2V66_11750 [Ignavibacteria bacterium RBG_13_36_8]|nr:MAG: hypothetical protein A2V66_11750 [Ignavibacteria bacterium RBG_13_36_8]
MEDDKYGICQITKKKFPKSQLVSGHAIREPIIQLIKEKYPDYSAEGYVSVKELNYFRQAYLQKLLEEEKGELSNIETEVLTSLQKAELLSKNIEPEIDEKLSIGNRVADKVALFGGSWIFIGSFLLLMLIWILINVFLLINRPFDPYPFILLNLILSCIAALQAPIIMMSQNRQESKDRQRSLYDYQINLKAEMEIRQLHEKIDHLIIHQNQRMFEIQQIQTELLQEIADKLNEKKN